MGTSIKLRWLGVAGIELKTSHLTLLFDPFLTRPPFRKLLLGRTRPDGALLRQHIPQADHILVSHAHYDHLLDVAEIASYTGARVYGSPNTCQLVRVCGLPEAQFQPIQAGDLLSFPPFRQESQGDAASLPPFRGELEGGSHPITIQILPGEHAPVPIFKPGRLPDRLASPLRLRDFVMDQDFGCLIQVAGLRLLNWHNWRPGPAPQADVLVIGADIHLSELGELIDQVQPRLLIPTHWDNFLRPLSKPLQPFFRPPCPGHPLPDRYDPWAVQRWVARQRPGVAVWVPELLQQIEL